MRGRILVTRPEPQASRTAARLKADGFEPILLPLTRTVPVETGSRPTPAPHDVLAVTSANAIRHAPRSLLEAFAHTPCFAVGRKTAAQARSTGLRSVTEGPGDALGLAEAIAQSEMRPRRVVYLCGRVRLPVFERALAKANIACLPVETYDTVEVSYPTEHLLHVFDAGPFDAVLVYSPANAAALQVLANRPEVAQHLADAVFFCLSGAIAKAMDRAGAARIRIAERPDEEALLALLAREFP